MVFVPLPAAVAEKLFARGWMFYSMTGQDDYRFVCAWDTTELDVRNFAADLQAVCSGRL